MRIHFFYVHNVRILAFLALLSVPVWDAHSQESLFHLNNEVPAGPEESMPTKDPVEAAVEKMDLRSQIAQLMIITAQGRQRPQVEDLALLKEYTPGGVVISSVLKQEFTSSYIARLRGVETLSGIPLWVGTNMYWLARRDRDVTTSFVQLPSLLAVAAANEKRATDNIAELMAQYMRGMGFNFHIGPYLTLAPRLSDAQGSINQLGSDPEVAAMLGTTMINTFAKYAVMPMVAGFPGGGANRAGQSPAVLLTSSSTILKEDLLPFSRVIQAGVPLVLVDNVLVPTLDDCNCPASLSKNVMQGWLRERLGFEGIIVAGPIDSSDITRQYDTAEAAILALKNGADMLFWQGADNAVMRGIDRLALAVELGELDRADIERSLRKVLEVKRLHGQLPGMEPEAIEGLKLKAKKLQELTHQVERRSITLVQNNFGVLPLGKDESVPLGITGVAGVDELHGFLVKQIKKTVQQPIYTAMHMGRIEDFEIDRLTEHMRGLRTAVCILSDELAVHGQVKLLKSIQEKGARVVAVLLGYPKLLPEIAAVSDAVVLVYCDEESNYTTMKALAEVLLGEGPVRILEAKDTAIMKVGASRVFDVRDVIRVPAGQLPVTVSDTFTAGWSVPYDPAKAIKKAQWDFGNGKKVSKDRVEFSYDSPGTYAATLTITDQLGEVTTGQFNIEVQ